LSAATPVEGTPVEGTPVEGAVVGLGLDLVDIGRLATVLSRRPGMAERLFTAGERGYAATLANPAPSLAARFAAKEAVMKALGVGLGAFGFTEVEIQRRPSGEPVLALSGAAAALAAQRGAASWLVSLTHTATTAAAVVLALA
jgi:holo-[acyl-carrier protein] synthase